MSLNLPKVIASSLAITGSLAWNELFKSIIHKYSPVDHNEKNIKGNVLYAIVITIFIFLTILLVNSILDNAPDSIKGNNVNKKEITLLIGAAPKPQESYSSHKDEPFRFYL